MIKQCGRTSACLLALITLTLLPAVAGIGAGALFLATSLVALVG